MPYTMENMPKQIKGLPAAAQKIWIAAFSAALEEYEGEESRAMATAWAAVERGYEKDDKGEWRAKAAVELSLDRVRDMLYEAIRKRFPPPGGDAAVSPSCAWVREVYPSHLIYEQGGKYFRVGWSLLDGEVTLGENPVEVEMQYVEVRSVQALIVGDGGDEGVGLMMRLVAAKDAEGSAWDVTVCEAGHTLNGWHIREEALRAACDEGLFEKADINFYELPGRGATHITEPLTDVKNLLVKNKAGWLDSVRYVAGEGLKGIVHFLDSAKQLGKNMLKAKDAGAPIYGLSWDAAVRAKKETVDGRVCMNIYKFNRVEGVDIVTRPAAGGKFNRAVASVMPAQNEEATMKKSLWDLIAQVRPDLLKGKVFDTVTDQECEAIARMAMEPAPGGGEPDPAVAALKTELATLRCGMALDRALLASELPEIAQKRVRMSFEGKVFEAAALTTVIADEKDYLAKVNGAGEPDPVSISGIRVGMGTFERAQMAVDRTFGLTAAQITEMARLERLDHQPFFADVRSTQDLAGYDQVPAFRGIREMYEFFTGDTEITGFFDRRRLAPELRSRMDINSGTFSFVLGNTLARRLVAVYRDAKFLEDLLISIRKPVRDFRTQEAVLVGGFPDLSTVDPEAADYQEIAGVTDEESTYVILQKGNILTITRKAIVNDDISIVQRLINGLGRTARRTHAKYVWNFAIANATCSDGTAWFTAPHANLGAAALSHATALIAYKALGTMTEKDSGERIGLLDDPSVLPNLIGPIDLMETIQKIATEPDYFTANDLTTKVPNPLKGKVNPVVLSLLTDATDWYMILPAHVADVVEMGYLNGRQEPELFTADSPQSEQVFIADKVRYKIRHEYAGAAIDCRTGYKAVVAG